MRIVKLKKLPARNPLVRLGIVPTKVQTREYLLELKAARAKLARAKAKPAARAKIAQFPKAVARAQKRKAA